MEGGLTFARAGPERRSLFHPKCRSRAVALATDRSLYRPYCTPT